MCFNKMDKKKSMFMRLAFLFEVLEFKRRLFSTRKISFSKEQLIGKKVVRLLIMFIVDFCPVLICFMPGIIAL